MKKRILAYTLTLIMTFAFSVNCFALQSPTHEPITTGTEGKISLKPVSSGNNDSGTWKKGNKDGLSFKSNKPLGKNIKVYVDGKVLDPSYYIIKDDNTVTLLPAYLESVSAGKHTVTVKGTKGSAVCPFTITKKGDNVQPIDVTPTQPGDGTSPKTSDNSSYVILGGLLLMIAFSSTLMLYSKRKVTE